MFVAVARLTLHIESSQSLKDKRGVVRRIKDRVRDRFHVVLSEVGDQAVLDSWQRCDLAFSVITRERDGAEDAVASIWAFIEELGLAERRHARHEVQAFGDEWYGAPGARTDEDAAWIPDAWREEAKR
jgi:hypothetical protein